MPKPLHLINAIACLLILSINAIAQPVIDHFSPASGPAGSSLVITGSGFSPSTTANTVFVGGAKATVTAASASSLTVTIPTGATYQPITVTTGGLQARSALSFVLTYPAGNPQLYPSAFAAPQDQTTLAYDGPQSTLAADLDGDGRPDIVNTQYGTQLFTIYRNASTKGGQNGPAAGFAGPAYFDPGINLNMPLGKYTFATAIGDLDGDGKPDVIITNQTEATISIFHNTSSPAALSFDPSFAVPCGGISAPHLAIGDLDGDGKPDVILAGPSKLVILKNNSTSGTIQLDSATSIDLPYLTEIAINDFDGDGKADIYTSYSGGTTASGLLFLLNTSSPGNFSFTAQPKMNVLIDGVKPLIGDMDGDGRPDLGLTSYSIPAISLFQNTSTPGQISFTALPNIKTAGQITSLNLGDLDGDGHPELAALAQTSAYGKSDTVVIFKNKSTAGTITYIPTLQLVTKIDVSSVLIADLDGDGKPDILTAQRIPPTALSVFRNRDNEPYIRTFLPATASSGSTVTLTGVSFTGATAVSFGGVPAASFTVVNDSTITATIAPGGASGNVLVTTEYGSFSLPGFEWKTAATPVITSFSPASAPAGGAITITGSNFDPAAANNTVYFGGMKATVTAASATSLTVIVPAGTTYSHLSVTANHLTAWSKAFFTLSFSGVVNANTPTSFAQELDFPNGFQAYGLTMDEPWTGDLDGDGRPDVLARASNDQLAIYRNTGKADTAMLSVTIDYLQMFVNDFAIADLDGDGKQDIVYCAQDYGAAWYTNSSTPGTIQFTAAGHPTDRASFFEYEHVKIADVDGDGKPDLIFSSMDSNLLVVYRNSTVNGVLSFANGISYTVGKTASAFIMPYVADLDGDNKPELIITNTKTNSVSVLKNYCTPGILSFGTQQDFAAGTQPQQLAVGDLNGDGLPELAVSDYDPSTGSIPTVTVLQNRSTPAAISLTMAQTLNVATGNFAYQSAIGDMDADGKPDLIVATGNTVALFPNTSSAGNISFAPQIDYPGVAKGATAVDLNGDGYTDILGVNGSSITLFKSRVNISQDLFTPPVITALTPASGPSGSSITITGQHFSPTASANTIFFGGIKAVVTAATATSLTVTVPIGAPFQPVSVTRQGLTAWSSQRWMTVYSNGNAPFDQHLIAYSADTTTDIEVHGAFQDNASVVSADFDGDGKADIVVTNTSAGSISVYRNNGSGGPFPFTDKTNYPANPGSLTSTLVMDIDGDGKLDLVVFNSQLMVLLNTSTPGAISFAAPFVPAHSPGNAGFGGVAADFDGDGRADILIDGYKLFRNITANGVVDFLPVYTFSTTALPTGVTVEDFNKDGKPDVALAYGDISVFTNVSTPGNFKFNTTTTYPGGAYRFVVSGDFDNDQNPDFIVTSDVYATSLTLFHNNGGGSFTSSTSPAPYGLQGILPGDLDGDGYPDLIITNPFDSYTNGLSILKNMGTKGKMSFAAPVLFAINNGVNSVAVTDWNADGSQDLLITSTYPSRLYAYAGRPLHPILTGFTPKRVSPGDKLVITGYNFTGASSVQLGGVAANFTIDSDNQITATAGEGGEGNLTVGNGASGDTLSGILFRAPVIISVTPFSGSVGTTLRITGDHFSAVSANNRVFFGSVKGQVTNASVTSLTVKAPAGFRFAPLSLTTFGESASAPAFGYRFASLGNTFSSGSFASRVDFTAADKPAAVAAGDLDGDGLPDLVAGNYVYRNTGGPGIVSLGAGQPFTTFDQSIQILLEDIDGDGKLDIVRLDRNIEVFLNTSTAVGMISFGPAFDLAINYTDGSGIAVSDLDGDGKKDIIVSSSFGETDVQIYINKSLGKNLAFTYSPASLDVVGVDMSGIVVADFDGDKKPDIAVLNYIKQNIRVFRNLGNADTLYFSPQGPILPTDGLPFSAVAADLDGDGLPELIVREEGLASSAGILVFANNSTPGSIALTGQQKMITIAYNSGVAVADWDGDGKPDIAAPEIMPGDAINVYRNVTTARGAFSFQPAVSYPAGNEMSMLKDVDWDADGKPDLVMVNNSSPGQISIIRNTSGEARVIPQGANPVAGPIINISMMDTTGQTLNGTPYVLRHYDITPEDNPSVATARVTLFFTQSDFDTYNAVANHGPDLPKSPTDAAGIANLRVYQYHGFTTTGQPGSYSGPGLEIDPADSNIVWDAAAQLWMVSFDVNGFSGFFLASVGFPYKQVPAPVIQAIGALRFCTGGSVALEATELPAIQWYRNGQAIPGAINSELIASLPGNYTATASNNGTTSPASVAIIVMTDTIAPKPIITLTNGALTSSVTAGLQWFQGGDSIPGATRPTFQPSVDGLYTVAATNGTCPASVSDAYDFKVNALIKIDDTHYLTVGPNPLRDHIVIRYNIANVTTLHLRVYDMQGRLCYGSDAVASGAQVSLASLANGVYVARLFSTDNSVHYSVTLWKD
jgi:hypothetical protein